MASPVVMMLSPPSTPAAGKSPNMSNGSRSPDVMAVQRVASSALQSRSVDVERLDGFIYRAFRLQSSSDFFYLLRCRPSSHIRLLRYEEDRLALEAGILAALRGRSDLLAPRLIEHKSGNIAIGSPYLVSGPFKGSILSDIEPQLSRQCLASIDKSIGQYVRQLVSVQGSAFGSVSEDSSSTSSWTRCFAAMLETVLRDAEDALISLPYTSIRGEVRRHRASLDQITQPKLLILEMCADRNIVVESGAWRISGILDWSTAMWGDPYMSDCFYAPSVSFVEGFGKLPNRSTDERIRQYLYILYHSVLAVVRHCYRPSDDGDEMEARRHLTTALSQLSGIRR